HRRVVPRQEARVAGRGRARLGHVPRLRLERRARPRRVYPDKPLWSGRTYHGLGRGPGRSRAGARRALRHRCRGRRAGLRTPTGTVGIPGPGRWFVSVWSASEAGSKRMRKGTIAVGAVLAGGLIGLVAVLAGGGGGKPDDGPDLPDP